MVAFLFSDDGVTAARTSREPRVASNTQHCPSARNDTLIHPASIHRAVAKSIAAQDIAASQGRVRRLALALPDRSKDQGDSA